MKKEELLRTTLYEKHQDEHFSVYGHEVYEKFTEDFILNLLKNKRREYQNNILNLHGLNL